MALSLPALTAGLARRVSLDEARKTWAAVRVEVGLKPTTPHILTHPEGNTKLNKTHQYGLSLLPARLAGVGNVCKFSTKGCRDVCLNTSGRGTARFVQEARKARTVLLANEPAAFATLMEREIRALPQNVALRLNVFSDIPWEVVWPEVFNFRPDIQFYDYTKWPVGQRASLPKNYHLTYSASELWTDDQIIDAVDSGVNVTVVLRLKKSQDLPTKWRGLPVVDGDKSDARYEDPNGVVVALRAKGEARANDTKFVRDADAA